MHSASVRTLAKWETPAVSILFAAMLVLHLCAISVGWRNGNLPGCEFRQTQTAISTLFIQQENNFSLAYPTPVLGKPWSAPMEFPLYQWTVVGLSNASGLTLTSAGRAVSVACFYLTLPALYLLLRRLGLGRSGRLVALSCFLSCPLYIFYSRAFLIETMALMFGAWYLVGLIETLKRRRASWLALAMVAGTGAGLVKVTTFILFLIPAFGWSVWCLWLAWTQFARPNWTEFMHTLGWLIAIHAIPFGAAIAWVRFSDAVKLANPMSVFLASSNMMPFNFGKGLHFDPAIWALHRNIIFREIVSPTLLIIASLLAILWGKNWRGVIVASVGAFIAIQFIFPGLYAWHEYYYVAGAVALIFAVGLAFAASFESSCVPPWIVLTLLIAGHVIQARAYWLVHYPIQSAQTSGMSGLTQALQRFTEPDDVLLIAGDDWSSITPYFSQRRALMLSSGTEHNRALTTKAFEKLKGERVTALLLKGAQRDNRELVELAAATFDLDPTPTVIWKDTVVYFHHQLRNDVIDHCPPNAYTDLSLAPEAQTRTRVLAGREFDYAQVWPKYRALFRTMNPRPIRFFSSVGPGPELWDFPGRPLQFSVHPETRLWFKLAPGPHRLRTALELVEASYKGLSHEEATDGVELIVTATVKKGSKQEVGRLRVNPRDVPSDRKPMPIDWRFTLSEEAELEVAVLAGPENNSRRDWAAIEPLSID